MNLGAFSISLAVQDLEVSRAFYEKLGFHSLGESGDSKYAIMKNGDHVIGLFEKMFEKNILTFNPGWDQSAQNIDEYTDIRELYKKLKDGGIEITNADIDSESGPASFSFLDPDGNPILIDQHR